MKNTRSGTRRHLIIGYSCSILLVLVYLNMFPAVRYIVKTWGTTPVLVLPILITVSALTAISLLLLRVRWVHQVQPVIAPIIIGIVICLVALIIPDPEAPVKRIHVIEYMMLSLLIRYTMSVRLQGISLLVYSILFSSLLGVHDELLQGLHPLRTYGSRDILVNALGSTGGGFIWHGFKLFEHSGQAAEQADRLTPRSCGYLAWLFCSVLFFFIPLVSFRQELLPLWPAAPLAASLIFFAAAAGKMPVRFNHGVIAVSCAAYALLAYPAVVRLVPAVFN
jgi:hypothetical protein